MTSSRFFYLTLVRHGQTEANKNLIVQGHQDVSLSDVGRSQAQRLAAHIQSLGLSYDTVYSSDLQRALETAQIVVGANKKVIVDERLRERCYGVFEGIQLHVLRDAAKKAGFNEKNYSSFIPEGAESLEEVRQRIQSFCHHQLLCGNHDVEGHDSPKGNGLCENAHETVIEASPCPPKNILLVTHGGVIREFMRFFRDSLKCQLPEGVKEPLIVTPNTGINVFRIFYKLNSRQDAFGDQNTALLLNADCLRIHDTTHLKDESPSETNKPTDNSNASSAPSSNSSNGDNLRADLHLA